MRLPTVAVIGAGAAGITATKALIDEGIDVVGYDRADRVGGLWVFQSSSGLSPAYASLHLNTSKGRTQFADHPMPAEWEDYPAAAKVAQYLADYADAHGVTEHIRFSTTVERVEKVHDPAADVERWAVEAVDGAGRTHVDHYDAVIVSNGHNWDPKWPSPQYPGTFTGTQMHAHDYRTSEVFRDRRVMVVGMGNSALLVEAGAPLVHAGSGVLHALATDELLAVAELLSAPITTSWSGRDVVDERGELPVPMIYPQLADQARTDSDVVLAIGTRLGETDWWGKAPHWRRPTDQVLVQVDSDEELLGLNKPVDVAVLADARVFLVRLAERLSAPDLAPALAASRDSRRARAAGYAVARETMRTGMQAALAAPSEPLHTAHLPAAMQRVLPEDTVFVLDGGTTSVWGALYHQVRQAHSVVSTLGKFGMLGAGVPQGLGAKVAAPERFVAVLTGDGAFGMHPQEIETAVRAGLPILVVVVVDRAWGMVKTTQEMVIDSATLFAKGGLPDEQHINTDFSEIRYDLMADSMGGRGLRVTASDRVEAVLEEARDLVLAGHPVVVHADVDQVAHKFAPILMTFKEMHAEPAG